MSASAAAEPLGHLLGEADDAHARLAANRCASRVAQLVVAAAEARDDGDVELRERRVDGACEVADAPAAARDEHDLARPAAARARGARLAGRPAARTRAA